MQFPDTAAANGRRAALPWGAGARSEVDELRSLCRSQALAIDALARAACTLRRGAAALKADNAALRAECERPPSGRRPDATATDRGLEADRARAVRLPCDARAPGRGADRRDAASARPGCGRRARERRAGGLRTGRQQRVAQRRGPRGCRARRRRPVAGDGSPRGRGSWQRRRHRPPSRRSRARRRLRPSARAIAQRALGSRTRRGWRHARLGAAARERARNQRRAVDDGRARPGADPIPISYSGPVAPNQARGKDIMTELHVIPDERTTWRVYEEGASAPLSEHTNATDAERAALTRVEDRD